MIIIKTKEDFDKIIDMIKANVNYYENYLTEVRYKLYLSGKNSVDISYEKPMIPHLLGIDMDYLRGANLYRETSAYELMKAFLNNNYAAYSKVENLNKIFSEYVVEKNMIFRDNLKILLSDIECVVHYQKERVYGHDTLECPCEYYILQKRNEEPNILLLLGITKNGGIYVPQTSQRLDLTLPKDRDTLKQILYRQHISFINNLRYSNSYDVQQKNFALDYQTRSDKIITLNRYALQYSATVCVNGDDEYILKRLNEAYMNSNKMKSTLQAITSTMITGEMIDMDTLESDTDYDIVELVRSYNNSRTVEKDSTKYSDLLDEYRKLKEEIECLKIENNRLQEISKNQSLAIEELETENDDYKNTHEKIFELLKKQQRGELIK